MHASVNVGCQGKTGPCKIHEVILVTKVYLSFVTSDFPQGVPRTLNAPFFSKPQFKPRLEDCKHSYLFLLRNHILLRIFQYFQILTKSMLSKMSI